LHEVKQFIDKDNIILLVQPHSPREKCWLRHCT
jgi:hypothetical protein